MDPRLHVLACGLLVAAQAPAHGCRDSPDDCSIAQVPEDSCIGEGEEGFPGGVDYYAQVCGVPEVGPLRCDDCDVECVEALLADLSYGNLCYGCRPTVMEIACEPVWTATGCCFIVGIHDNAACD